MRLGLRGLMWLFGDMFRRPEPLPERARTRECHEHGCGMPAMRTGVLCEGHEIAERLDMYDPVEGWGVR